MRSKEKRREDPRHWHVHAEVNGAPSPSLPSPQWKHLHQCAIDILPNLHQNAYDDASITPIRSNLTTAVKARTTPVKLDIPTSKPAQEFKPSTSRFLPNIWTTNCQELPHRCLYLPIAILVMAEVGKHRVQEGERGRSTIT